MTQAGIKNLVDRIAALYNLRVHPATGQAWYEVMVRISDTEGLAALARHVEEGERPPKPADLLRLAKVGRVLIDDSPEERLGKIDRREAGRIRKRLESGDEREESFQLFMARKLDIEGSMTDEDEDYFVRWFGPNWREKAGIPLS